MPKKFNPPKQLEKGERSECETVPSNSPTSEPIRHGTDYYYYYYYYFTQSKKKSRTLN
jgi:hypothetical protein